MLEARQGTRGQAEGSAGRPGCVARSGAASGGLAPTRRPTAKHERFAQLLADGLSQHEAYLRAGFRCSSAKVARAAATNLLKRNVNIRERVATILAGREQVKARATAQAVETTAMDKTWVLQALRRVYDMAIEAVPVLNTKGEPTGRYRADLGAANRAAELIGKEQGMFVERREVKGADAVDALLAQVPTDVLRLMERRLERLIREHQE